MCRITAKLKLHFLITTKEVFRCPFITDIMQTNICMIASTQTKQRRKRIKIVSDIG